MMTLEESAMSSLAGYGPDPFTVESFRPWLDLRSPEEPWELIDGIAVMNLTPRVAHQRIARNFEYHLRLALARHKPEWSADRGIGIDVANDSRYRPEPELTVVDMDIDPTQNYLDRFYMAVEVARRATRVARSRRRWPSTRIIRTRSGSSPSNKVRLRSRSTGGGRAVSGGREPCARHPTSWRSGKSASSARWATSTDTRISIRRT
jgi:hypothetical protein